MQEYKFYNENMSKNAKWDFIFGEKMTVWHNRKSWLCYIQCDLNINRFQKQVRKKVQPLSGQRELLSAGSDFDLQEPKQKLDSQPQNVLGFAFQTNH